ncbi:glycosyltransferase family 2 protein [Photobacterium angustum]|uniref:glycosyltransferase family 2 protein n=1 Tax=Photobacterium angustum TaxID=661 RepID=UPI0005EBD6D9|nr:glycosyltransferase family 2 protein [Photobacterium angustum]PSV90440.1 glycosyltransferase [Photobacterium angustum]PSW83151.1 glycosyltransferase [Photobacterium angustum]
MKVTIITVCYNSEKTINRTIKSVLAQTYKDIEYLIIDGGSKDKTLDIIRQHPEIKYISEKDKGIYNAMNKGLHLASGDIVAFLNSDDYYQDNKVIDKVVSSFNNSHNFVFGDIKVIDDERSYLRKANLEKIKFGMTINHPALFISSNLIENITFDESLKIAADYDFVLTVLNKKINYKYLNECLVVMDGMGVSNLQKDLGEIEEKAVRKKHTNLILYYFVTFYKFISKALK